MKHCHETRSHGICVLQSRLGSGVNYRADLFSDGTAERIDEAASDNAGDIEVHTQPVVGSSGCDHNRFTEKSKTDSTTFNGLFTHYKKSKIFDENVEVWQALDDVLWRPRYLPAATGQERIDASMKYVEA